MRGYPTEETVKQKIAEELVKPDRMSYDNIAIKLKVSSTTVWWVAQKLVRLGKMPKPKRGAPRQKP